MTYGKMVFLRNFVILAPKTSKERFLLLNLHFKFIFEFSIFNFQLEYGRQIFAQSS